MKPIKRNIVRARRGQLSAFIRLFPLRLSGALRWNTRRDSSEMGWIRITAAHHSTLQWKFSSDFSCSWLHHSILTWDLNKIKATTLFLLRLFLFFGSFEYISVFCFVWEGRIPQWLTRSESRDRKKFHLMSICEWNIGVAYDSRNLREAISFSSFICKPKSLSREQWEELFNRYRKHQQKKMVKSLLWNVLLAFGAPFLLRLLFSFNTSARIIGRENWETFLSAINKKGMRNYNEASRAFIEAVLRTESSTKVHDVYHCANKFLRYFPSQVFCLRKFSSWSFVSDACLFSRLNHCELIKFR